MLDIKQLMISEQKPFPNSVFPVLIYPQVFEAQNGLADFSGLFASNNWQGIWENGVYGFHHFHADAHEVLGCRRGWVKVRLGGPLGRGVVLNQGDAVLIPAGVGHMRMDQSPDYSIVGAYPPKQSPDLQRGEAGYFEEMKLRVAAVALPKCDPITGSESFWKASIKL